MAINVNLTNSVRDILQQTPNTVEEKKMFRGIAFMVNGKMCVTVGDDEMMVRIDPTFHDTAIKQKGVRTVIMKGRDYVGWVLVKESSVKLKNELRYWIKLALDYNKMIV